MTKTISLAAALALSVNVVSPAGTLPDDTPIAPSPNTGSVAIVLTTEDGELTDIAEQGLEAPATEPSARLTRAFSHSAGSGTLAASSPFIKDEDVSEDSSENYELFSAPIAVDNPFAVAALTWDSDSPFPQDATIEMRTLDGNQWSQWYELEQEECVSGADRCGSEYMVSGSSTGIQARVSRTDGSLPADLRIDISYSISGKETVIDDPEVTDILPPDDDDSVAKSKTAQTIAAFSSTAPAFNAVNTHNTAKQTKEKHGIATAITVKAAPLSNTKANIQPRSAWGANESLRTWRTTYVNFEGVIVHHTAGSNDYTQAQVPSVIQGIYRYHAVTLEWGDIGYNVLIDKYGGRWEGRYGTLASPKRQMVIGGHAKPRNTNTMGISVLGDYSYIQPTDTVLTAISEVSAWKFIDADINPASTSPLTIPAETGTMKGQVGMPLNRIVGHMDVYPTACPGTIYNYLGQIRQNTQALYQKGAIPAQIAEAQNRVSDGNVPMFRLYNPETREHLYTSDKNEALKNVQGAWNYEGVSWVAPEKSAQPIYRLHYPPTHEHFYSGDPNEIRVLTEGNGWENEGVAWYSSTTSTQLPVYRQYNPDLPTGAHHFTTDPNEYNTNNAHGWQGEGIAWYANTQGWTAN